MSWENTPTILGKNNLRFHKPVFNSLADIHFEKKRQASWSRSAKACDKVATSSGR